MQKFDEFALVHQLATLPKSAWTAFATAAATRQLCCYERFANIWLKESVRRPREIVLALWADLDTGLADHALWTATLHEVMALMPAEDDLWTVDHSLADNALSSLAYAIRCRLTPSAQEAAWSARRAYEAADQAAIRFLGIQPGSRSSEESILAHEVVQRELDRQQRDLLLLGAGSADEVARSAFSSNLLTPNEVAALG